MPHVRKAAVTTPSDPRAMLDRLEREYAEATPGTWLAYPSGVTLPLAYRIILNDTQRDLPTLLSLSRDALRYRELAEEAVDLLEGYAVAYTGRQATAAEECAAKLRAVLEATP